MTKSINLKKHSVATLKAMVTVASVEASVAIRKELAKRKATAAKVAPEHQKDLLKAKAKLAKALKAERAAEAEANRLSTIADRAERASDNANVKLWDAEERVNDAQDVVDEIKSKMKG